MPLSDRDYMRGSSPPPRRRVRFSRPSGFTLNPILVIIIINFLVFIVTTISRDALYNVGLIPDIVWERPWTIITSLFAHSSIMHILFNMLALYFLGRTLMHLIGSNWFVLVYFTGGIIANIVYVFLNSQSVIPLVGASGAVYAIAGAMVVMVPNMRVALWGIIPMPLWVFVIVFLVLLSLPPFVSVNVAWQAHLVGLVIGLVAGYFYRRRGGYYYIR